MPIQDKIAAARKISELLNGIIQHGDFRLKYKIMVDPPPVDEHDEDHPLIMVDLSGADSSLVLERGAELLRAFEQVALEMLRLAPEEHDQVLFDCQNFRSSRKKELRLAAQVAAEKVRTSGSPYAFAPMSSRERRLVHIALRTFDDLRTESAGEALQRYVVVYPKGYTGKPPSPVPSRSRR
jgi:spoIIIJ-associated protein